MGTPAGVVFDIGNVLFHWHPRYLYERLIPDGQALDAFLREVVTLEWHFQQHDQGRPFAETSAELIARFPQHAALIRAWGPRFNESIGGPVDGMHELVVELEAAGVPLYAITNFSGEFFWPFREAHADLFDRFRDIVVSGDERLVKPHPEIWGLALARFDLPAEALVFVDDNEANVAGAAAAGFRALHFTSEPRLRAELKGLGLLPGTEARAA